MKPWQGSFSITNGLTAARQQTIHGEKQTNKCVKQENFILLLSFIHLFYNYWHDPFKAFSLSLHKQKSLLITISKHNEDNNGKVS